jgi:hypothetical protein
MEFGVITRLWNNFDYINLLLIINTRLFVKLITVNIQMYSAHNFDNEDKENVHPNRTQPVESYQSVQEGDFSKIGQRYVLDG